MPEVNSRFLSTLTAAWELRRRRNPSYSLRAFARDVGVHASTMSRTFAGQRPAFATAVRLADGLQLTGARRRTFLEAAAKERCGLDGEETIDAKALDNLTCEILSSWFHTAILELTFVEGFNPSPRWIARRLGITSIEATAAVDRLVKAGLLTRTGKSLTKSDRHLASADKSKTSLALRQHQKQILRLADVALSREPIEARSTVSMAMAIDPEKIPLAKKMIEDFTWELCKLLEDGRRQRVYQLQVNLFPTDTGSIRKEDT